MKLREGNVFTPVCHSVHSGGSIQARGGLHLGCRWMHPPPPEGGWYASYWNAYLLAYMFTDCRGR